MSGRGDQIDKGSGPAMECFEAWCLVVYCVSKVRGSYDGRCVMMIDTGTYPKVELEVSFGNTCKVRTLTGPSPRTLGYAMIKIELKTEGG